MLAENVLARLSYRPVPGILHLLVATDQRSTKRVTSLLRVARHLAAPPLALAVTLKPLVGARSSPQLPMPGRGSLAPGQHNTPSHRTLRLFRELRSYPMRRGNLGRFE